MSVHERAPPLSCCAGNRRLLDTLWWNDTLLTAALHPAAHQVMSAGSFTPPPPTHTHCFVLSQRKGRIAPSTTPSGCTHLHLPQVLLQPWLLHTLQACQVRPSSRQALIQCGQLTHTCATTHTHSETVAAGQERPSESITVSCDVRQQQQQPNSTLRHTACAPYTPRCVFGSTAPAAACVAIGARLLCAWALLVSAAAIASCSHDTCSKT